MSSTPLRFPRYAALWAAAVGWLATSWLTSDGPSGGAWPSNRAWAQGAPVPRAERPLDPYYPHRAYPKLTTPQWAGDPGVDCVVTLGIDDMRDPGRYAEYLRPIVERLKRIDGRAPVSIMTCQVQPDDPRLQQFLADGMSLEVHTVDHPCPCLQGGDFAKARDTFERCVDLIGKVPGARPVAFRMPCCDSLNTPSPRFWAEIFAGRTPSGAFLSIDSSVFNLITPADPELPVDLVRTPTGEARFKRYVPFPSFVNTIEDYPYPYVIGGVCWQFPGVVPSDWSAQHVQKANNPDTVRDLKLALDAVVLKQGVYNLVFHPHGWIRNEQIVELIDYAATKYGRRVKFLTFRECLERLDRHLLDGHPLRDAQGARHGVSLVDLDADGLLDVVVDHPTRRRIRRWNPGERRWIDGDFDAWARVAEAGLPAEGRRLACDLDGDGADELLVQDASNVRIFQRAGAAWQALPFTLPADLKPFDERGRDSGLRLVDLDGDRRADVLFSDGARCAVYLLRDLQVGWAEPSFDVRRDEPGGGGGAPIVPPIVRADGTNGGAWIHSGRLWFQNEDTQRLPDHVDRIALADLVKPARDRQAFEGRLPAPKSPAEALRTFSIRPGWKIELVAAEPLVEDPVAFDWGLDGSLWVAEMRDYPNGVDWQKPGDPVGRPGGRVKRLFDDDGDGRYDRATLFLDGLPFPTGVKVWRDGLIVSTAPDVFFAADDDGDGRADRRETLLAGFREGNQQHRVNGLRWGVDNWLYLANGDSGGRIRSIKADRTIDIGGRDLRFRPDTGELDAQSGQTQFGRNRNDWGDWFGGNNSNPLWHYVLEDHYLRRNPHVPSPDVRKHVPVRPGAAPVFPTSVTVARFNDFNMSNRFTSACSPELFRDRWPEPQEPAEGSHLFICEPVHNLVHHAWMTADGASFTSRRPDDEQEREFLSSTDGWFRPVMVRTGPDGGVWIADMYRAVIEHPEWIPTAWQRRLDLRAGSDRGRIYRAVPTTGERPALPRLDRLDDSALVAGLASSNGWRRDTIQQQLIWRHSASPGSPAAVAVVEALRRLAAESPVAVARLHALGALDALDGLTPELLAARLQDAHPGVRRHAARLAEPRLDASPELARRLVRLADDPDPLVRLQVACSLGAWSAPESGETLAKMLLAAPDDPYLPAAVFSSARPENLPALIDGVLRSPDAPPAARLVEPLLATAVASDDRRILSSVVARIAASPDGRFAAWQWNSLAALLDAFRRRKIDERSDDFAATRAALDRALDAARRSADDDERPVEERRAAVRLIGQSDSPTDDDRRLLGELLTPRQAPELQLAAVQALGRFADDASVDRLLAGWKSHGPTVRSQILDLLLNRDASTERLVRAIEAGDVPAAQLDARRRQQLAAHRNERVRAAAEKLFAAASSASRAEVTAKYAAALDERSGDALRGREVYLKRCSNCHRLDGAGHAVGPDLAASAGKSTDVLLASIFDPNRAIEDRYLDYVVVTDDGRQLSGMLAAETGASLTLLGPEAKSTTVLRNQIEELRSTGKSLMPEGLERDLTPAELADLLAFLRRQAPPPKKFDGNEPAVVRAGEDGVLRLTAAQARIYGPTLVFETTYKNLGYWSHVDDRAAWSLETPRAGKYRIEMDYASQAGADGDAFVLTVAGRSVEGRVESTGTWDDYRSKTVGTVELPAGAVELTMRSAGPIKSALIDLRTIRLIREQP